MLGLRVKNIGYGTARNFKLDSSQPQIVANANGLLVGFELQQCEVNGVARVNSLLVDLGNIAPGASASANWIMTCSLSGIFTNFTASFSHSD